MSNPLSSFAEWHDYPLTLDPILIAKSNRLHHPAKVLLVEEIPKLGSGKKDFGAIKKIASVNYQA
jgi:hypothetical protein